MSEGAAAARRSTACCPFVCSDLSRRRCSVDSVSSSCHPLSLSLCCCIIEQSINQRLEGRQEARGAPGLVPFATSRLPPSLPSLYPDQQRSVVLAISAGHTQPGGATRSVVVLLSELVCDARPITSSFQSSVPEATSRLRTRKTGRPARQERTSVTVTMARSSCIDDESALFATFKAGSRPRCRR